MRDLVVAHVPRDRPIRLLDVGCGTGSLLFRLADALPDADLTGIDVTPANIHKAKTEQAGRGCARRVRFETADYLAFTAPPFDAVVTDGVLHLVAGDTMHLVRKLADDVRPGGVIICSMPYDCAYNRAFAALRRRLRPHRSASLDALILRVGRLLHGREMDDDGLRERVHYMYMPPERMMSAALEAAASSAGLRVVARYPMRNTSLSQLRHRVTVFERTMGPLM